MNDTAKIAIVAAVGLTVATGILISKKEKVIPPPPTVVECGVGSAICAGTICQPIGQCDPF